MSHMEGVTQLESTAMAMWMEVDIFVCTVVRCEVSIEESLT